MNNNTNAEQTNSRGAGYSNTNANPALGDNYSMSTDTNVSRTPMPDVPTTEVEYGGGQPGPAELGVEVPSAPGKDDIPNSGPTIQLTDYSAATDYTYDEGRITYIDEVNDSRPDDGSLFGFYVKKRPIPFALLRGTTYLSPFGLVVSKCATIGQASPKYVSAFGQMGEYGALYAQASGRLASAFNLREVNNYKSFSEMKDAIDSYKSRSIAFTNLEVMDMLQLECAREERLLCAALPLYASKMAKEYVRLLSEMGLSFNTDMASNLISAAVNNAEYLIYAALANQKTFDVTSWDRLNYLAKLRQSSQRVGVTPQFIMEDVDVSITSFYLPEKKIKVQNYTVSVPKVLKLTSILSAGSNTSAANMGNHRSLMNWINLYLGGAESEPFLLAALDNALSLLNDTINGMKIITGAIDTIEGNRGASFAKVGEYLPIKGVHSVPGNAFLDYYIERPQFSYYYKERVEHAPSQVKGESPTGANNVIYTQSIVDGLGTAFSDLSSSEMARARIRRPVGLHKGEKSWTTGEIASIGIYRPVQGRSPTSMIAALVAATWQPMAINGAGVNQAPTLTWWVGPGSPSLTTGGIEIGDENVIQFSGQFASASTAPYGFFIDQLYGDIYCDSIVSPGFSKGQDGSYASDTLPVHTDIVVYAGNFTRGQGVIQANPSWSPIFCALGNLAPLDTLPELAASETRSVAFQGVNYNNASADDLVGALLAMNDAYSQLDISQRAIITPGAKAGVLDIPFVYATPYRGAQWYEMTITTMASTLIHMSGAFAMTYLNNAAVRSSRSASRSESGPVSVR